ncbi:MAG: hypothetical protein LBR39_06240 [Coriobacteriales bacterium]|jgi:hypothetical protein|nr:hypothetical protein [Coriobacteriales bacterium]
MRESRIAGIVFPVVLLVICLGAFFLPHISFPLFGGLSASTVKGFYMMLQSLPQVPAAASSFSWAALWEVVTTTGPFVLAIAITVIVVLVLIIGLLIAAAVFACFGLYHGIANHTQRSLRHASRGAWFVFFIMLISALGLLLLNFIFNWQIQGGAANLGVDYLSIQYIKPSIFIWLLLLASLALIIASAVVRRRLKRPAGN